MRKFFFSLSLAMSFAFLVSAQNRIDFKEFTLDNGLHVIMHQDNSTPIVAVSVLYHVGSKNERQIGRAHV